MRIKVYRKYLVWRVKLVSANNRVIMNSEAYYSKSNATRIAVKLREELGIL